MRVRARMLVVGMAAAASVATAPLAFAGGGNAFTAPSVQLTQGTGTQTVDISISAGSPLVGDSADGIEVSAMESSGMSWFQGVSGGSSGGSCSADGSRSWQCTPGPSGWQAGHLTVSISTAKANCTAASGVTQSVCQIDTYTAQTIVFSGNTPQTWRTGGTVEIIAKPSTSATHTATTH